jgi:ABC-type transport system involved in multi-copper enzyme maturation permease subunit
LGTQQLLLLVVALIIVGAAIIIGIKLFGSSAVMANRDSISAELHTLAAVSMQYYKKPREIGGGSNSFTNWQIPSQLDSTAYGTYTASPTGQVLTITGVGTEIGNDGTNYVKLVATITQSDISMSVEN